jgi:hypothetical protein
MFLEMADDVEDAVVRKKGGTGLLKNNEDPRSKHGESLHTVFRKHDTTCLI